MVFSLQVSTVPQCRKPSTMPPDWSLAASKKSKISQSNSQTYTRTSLILGSLAVWVWRTRERSFNRLPRHREISRLHWSERWMRNCKIVTKERNIVSECTHISASNFENDIVYQISVIFKVLVISENTIFVRLSAFENKHMNYERFISVFICIFILVTYFCLV